MQRNYVTNTRIQPQQQQKYANQDEFAKKNIELGIKWQRQRRQRNLEMNLAHRRHSQDFPIENYAVFSSVAYPRETFINTRSLPVWSNNENVDVIEFWNKNQNGFGHLERENEEQKDIHEVVHKLTMLGRFLDIVQNWPLPRLSFTTACIIFLLVIFIAPRPCVQSLLFPAFRLSFGTLYPAYASYKAVRTKNVKEYVKWMMYWIVYAFFTCTETFTDIFLSWFPFYYEVKVIIVLWLLSPATKGSSTLYRKFVHPMLTRREQEIDEYLNQAKERGYSAVLHLGSKGVNYATNVIMQTALKGGGNLVQTIRRSYSLSDLSEPDTHRTQDEIDEVCSRAPPQRILRPRLQTALGRSASGTRHSTGMYFTEVDVNSKAGSADFSNYSIRSSEDISSGYSSAEPISGGLSRTSSMTNASKAKLKAKRSEVELPILCDNSKYCFPYEDERWYYHPSLNEALPFPLYNAFNQEGFLNSEEHFQRSKNLSVFDGVSSFESEESSVFEEAKEKPVKEFIPEINNKTDDELITDEVHEENNLPVNELEIKMPSDSENEEFLDTISSHSSDVGIIVPQNQVNHNTTDGVQIQLTSTEPITYSTESIVETVPSTTSQDGNQVQQNDDPKIISVKTPGVSPKGLKQALDEIKDSFRESIIPQEKGNKSKLCHNKGQAPAPPTVSPRNYELECPLACDTLSLQSTTNSNSRSPSPADRRATKKARIFKNFKSNIFRTETKSNVDEKRNSISSTHKETEI